MRTHCLRIAVLREGPIAARSESETVDPIAPLLLCEQPPTERLALGQASFEIVVSWHQLIRFDRGKPLGYSTVMDERELSLAVVGIGYENDRKSKGDRRFEMMLCAPGDPIELRREPKNKHDKYAVAVFTERGTQLGYLNAERAPWIGGKILAGEEYVAVYQQSGAVTAVIRVRSGGGSPTLPLARPAAQSSDESGQLADDFEADPDGPEWGA